MLTECIDWGGCVHRFFKYFNGYGKGRWLSGSMRARSGDVDVRWCSGGRAVSYGQYAMLPSRHGERHQLIFWKCYRWRGADLDRVDDNYDFYNDTRDNRHDAQHVYFLYFGKNYTGASSKLGIRENKLGWHVEYCSRNWLLDSKTYCRWYFM